MATEQFTGKNLKGEDVTYFVKKPTAKDYQQAKIHSSAISAQIMRRKTEDGKPAFTLRSQIGQIAKDSGLWDDSTEAELRDISKQITEKEKLLSRGGAAGLTLKKGFDLSLDISELRQRQMAIIQKTTDLDKNTLESIVENANFEYLVSACLLDEEGKRVFNSVEEYQEALDVDPYVVDGAGKLANMIYGLADKDNDFPETKFLKKYKFADDKGRLINKDGHLVDRLGRLINEDNRLVDKEGNLVDSDGNPVDEDGNPLGEFEEFLDEEPVTAKAE